jgi:hypothetical protein
VLDWVGWLVAAEVVWWLLVALAIQQARALRKQIESIPVELF